MQALVRALGVLMMITALAVALTYTPDRGVDTLVTMWAPPPSDFMYVKGQFVHYRDEGPRGDPAPLVLIHGTAASLHTWEGWAAELRGRKRVITFDLPGFGLTGPFTGQYPRDDYHVDTLARFTLDLLDALKVPRFAIGGNSLGGEVAWRVATLAPARVDRLILVDATGYPFKPELVPLGFRVTRVPVINRVGEWLTPRVLVQQSVRDVYADPSRVTDALVDRYFELLTREGNRHALNMRMEEVARDLVPERIKTLKLPTLILWGAKDRLVPPVNAHHFQQDIAGSQLVIFPNLAHVPHEEDPRTSIVPVLAFLGLDAPTPPTPPSLSATSGAAAAASTAARSAETTP